MSGRLRASSSWTRCWRWPTLPPTTARSAAVTCSVEMGELLDRKLNVDERPFAYALADGYRPFNER